MESSDQSSSPPDSKYKPSTTIPIRVEKSLSRLIHKEIQKLNKKEFGRSVTASEYLAKAVSKLTAEDLSELQSATLSSSDRFEMLYRENAKTQTKPISKEEFLGRLLADFAGAAAQVSVGSTRKIGEDK